MYIYETWLFKMLHILGLSDHFFTVSFYLVSYDLFSLILPFELKSQSQAQHFGKNTPPVILSASLGVSPEGT